MDKNLGIRIFADVCKRYKSFSHYIDVPTTQCQSFITGGPNVQMNYVYDLDIRDEQAFIHDLALLRATHIPMMLLCETNSAEKHDALFKSGHLTLIGSAQSKYISLADWAYTPSPAISIREVNTEEMMIAWRKIAATAFEYPYGCDELLFQKFIDSGDHDAVKLYLAYIDDKAVGQAMLVLCDDASANMWSSVLPEYRNRGILTELIKYRNAVASQRGCTQSVVQCMPTSAPMYDNLHYKNAEKINLYTL